MFSAIGSIATASAVIVALWESRRSSTEKLKVTMNIYIDPANKDVSYIGVSVTNIGVLPVKVNFLGFTSKKQFSKHAMLVLNPIFGNYSSKIEPNDSGFYCLMIKENFAQGIKEDVKKGYYEKSEKIYISVSTPLKSHAAATNYKFQDFI